MKVGIGDTVLIEKGGEYREALVRRIAEVSELAASMDKYLLLVQPLHGFFRKSFWVSSYRVAGKL